MWGSQETGGSLIIQKQDRKQKNSTFKSPRSGEVVFKSAKHLESSDKNLMRQY